MEWLTNLFYSDTNGAAHTVLLFGAITNTPG